MFCLTRIFTKIAFFLAVSGLFIAFFSQTAEKQISAPAGMDSAVAPGSSVVADSQAVPVSKQLPDSAETQTVPVPVYSPPIQKLPNKAFGVGEILRFSINWGFINVGSAVMKIKGIKIKKNRPCFEIEATARSNKAISTLYPVRDRFLSYLDTTALIPHEYFKYQNEGSYHFDQHTVFDQKNKTVKTWGKRTKKKKVTIKDSSFQVPPLIYDVISAFYFTRIKDLKKGTSFILNNIDNNKLAKIQVKVLKRDKIKVGAGKFNCVVVEPQMSGIGLFKKKGKLRVWLTDDVYKMPVMFKSKITIGSIKGKLESFKRGKR
jgi:hypothetical protein